MKNIADTKGLPGAQGEINFIVTGSIPTDAKKVEAVNGQYIIGHSESGHHHIIKEQDGVEVFESANDNTVIYLRVNNTTALLEHMRGFDTHEGWSFSNGVYKMRRQVESFLEGFRRAID